MTSQERLQGSSPKLELLKNGYGDLLQIWHKCSLWGPDQVWPKSNIAALAYDWLTPFRLLLKNGCKDLLHILHKCGIWGFNQVLLLF